MGRDRSFSFLLFFFFFFFLLFCHSAVLRGFFCLFLILTLFVNMQLSKTLTIGIFTILILKVIAGQEPGKGEVELDSAKLARSRTLPRDNQIHEDQEHTKERQAVFGTILKGVELMAKWFSRGVSKDE